MAIDLRQVEPLGSKSVLLEQAMRRSRANNGPQDRYEDMDMSDMITPDFEWLKEDKTAIESLVKQMDASIGQLAGQMRELDDQGKKSRLAIEKEQQLLFKQIKTLNSLLKRQVDIFVSVERQMAEVELKQNNLIPQIGIGLIAGLMSAVTILVTAPWLTVLMENLR
ncbi:hypothetical protein THMIRHAM_19550 [Thiomicrorhabdus immobilis]|uniref:DUF1640 domain-containing protein n=1 Tax=Thiomicrorhabdus immobilis TaxID=2791037 RepID=A0ABN6D212_9GAMM|nr:hypothetical protein [Thiomicrorhabdus immobilis]BCN94170.1 hypothetical protein THMIRHAM_19550 [Thiomicrorhabdus immobilis]